MRLKQELSTLGNSFQLENIPVKLITARQLNILKTTNAGDRLDPLSDENNVKVTYAEACS